MFRRRSTRATDGKRYYDMRFNALKDRSGKQVGAFVVVYDVTDRASEQARLAEAEARVRQAQKIEAIGQLTGGVAHDFNNLLMVISGGLEVMDALAPARSEKVIAGMRQAVEKGAGLSRQLLAFSRRQPLRPEAGEPGAQDRRHARDAGPQPARRRACGGGFRRAACGRWKWIPASWNW